MNAPPLQARAAIAALAARHTARTHPRKPTWLIALSGGVDSRVLLDLCAAYRRANPATAPRLITAHVHHHLRQSASEDARFCELLCASLPEVSHHHTVHLDSSHWRGSTQQAARKARYEALSRLAVEHEADAILTAHHFGDALETFVMHAARGSGSRGLSSLARQVVDRPPHATPDLPDHVELCRPLLAWNRRAIESHAIAEGLEWVEDPTNMTDTYTRNTIRHDVLPLLEDVHGNGEGGWRRTLDHLREEADFIDATVEALWRRAVLQDWPVQGAIFLDRDALLEAHPYVIKRTLMRAHQQITSARACDASQLEELVRMARGEQEASTMLALPGARAEREDTGVVLLPTHGRDSRGWFDEAPEPVQLDLHEEEGSLPWFHGEIVWRVDSDASRDDMASCILLCPGQEVWVRGPRPGERTGGEKGARRVAIKEVLRKQGVPAWRRHLWPCLEVCDEDGSRRVEVLQSSPSPWEEEARANPNGERILLHVSFVVKTPHTRSS